MAARFAAGLAPDARVLEIGSGPGHDAALLERLGLHVRRTDVSRGFAELMRADGHRVDVLDPLVDDLTDPERPGTPYDGVWANASLLHVVRPDLVVVLRRLADVTRPGGLLEVTLKEGDGDAWSTHGHVSGPRHFTYWRPEPLRAVLAAAGWEVATIEQREGWNGTRWLDVRATRAER
ncbi:class I SAM-dependent methyltransferase [Nocardioides sp. KIGAM211]|uniref:Class I SAM-dependent methyltransferase n=2 Tax=Nocardioides luti TaxID=2761101 RepID=A0A7X0RJP5_9ACTN|nr:class I SAM-dependent methyltransferase [Nocardioides luti]